MYFSGIAKDLQFSSVCICGYNFQGVCLFAYLNADLVGGVIFIAFLAICSVQLHKKSHPGNSESSLQVLFEAYYITRRLDLKPSSDGKSTESPHKLS